jgi:hypothetical protein
VPGQKIHVHHRAVGQIRDPIEAGDWWHQRAPTHIDEDPVGLKYVIADLQFFWPGEPGVGQVQELLDFLTWISSFEGFTLRPTIASYS